MFLETFRVACKLNPSASKILHRFRYNQVCSPTRPTIEPGCEELQANSSFYCRYYADKDFCADCGLDANRCADCATDKCKARWEPETFLPVNLIACYSRVIFEFSNPINQPNQSLAKEAWHKTCWHQVDDRFATKNFALYTGLTNSNIFVHLVCVWDRGGFTFQWRGRGREGEIEIKVFD